MRLVMWLTGLSIVGVVGMLVWAMFQPSCADRGGYLEFSHFQPVLVNNMTQLIPIYTCRMQ